MSLYLFPHSKSETQAGPCGSFVFEWTKELAVKWEAGQGLGEKDERNNKYKLLVREMVMGI